LTTLPALRFNVAVEAAFAALSKSIAIASLSGVPASGQLYTSCLAGSFNVMLMIRVVDMKDGNVCNNSTAARISDEFSGCSGWVVIPGVSCTTDDSIETAENQAGVLSLLSVF
jgi:hypothetical protein